MQRRFRRKRESFSMDYGTLNEIIKYLESYGRRSCGIEEIDEDCREAAILARRLKREKRKPNVRKYKNET